MFSATKRITNEYVVLTLQRICGSNATKNNRSASRSSTKTRTPSRKVQALCEYQLALHQLRRHSLQCTYKHDKDLTFEKQTLRRN